VHVVSVINYKGGVGKTTLTANLAAELAARGNRVLMLDFDPQISLTLSFYTVKQWEQHFRDRGSLQTWFDTIEFSGQVSLADFAKAPEKAEEALRNRGTLRIIPSHFRLMEQDLRLAALMSSGNGVVELARSRQRVLGSLRSALGDPRLGEYDFILIDCPPNFNVPTRMALLASDFVLVPTRADYLSTIGLRYLVTSYERAVASFNEDALIAHSLNARLSEPRLLGLVFTMVQFSSGDHLYRNQDQYVQQIRGEGFPTFARNLRYSSSQFGNSGEGSVPVALLGKINSDVAHDLEQIVTEFIKRISNDEGVKL
jgi:chromosome partitioning protein